MGQLAPGFGETKPGPKLAKGFGTTPQVYQDPYSSPSENPRLEEGRLVTTSDVEDYMASNQSGWELWGKGLAQGTSEAVLGTIEGASYLFDLKQHWDTLNGAEQEFGNWLGDAMKEAKKNIEEATHVYQTRDSREAGFAPWDATWWATNAPTLGTSLALLIPAGAVGKAAGTVGKALGAGAKASVATEGISAAVASRLMESTMEANQTYERTFNELAPTFGEEAAKAEAGVAASRVYKGNWAFLAQDMFQYMTMLKGFGSSAKGAKGMSLGQLGKQIVSEAGEEAGQFILAEESYQDVVNPTVDFFGKGLSDRLADYVRDPEFKTAAFFGGLGGGIFTVAGPAARKAVSGIEKISDFAKGLYRPSAERQTVEDLTVQEANYRGDKATSQRARDVIFARKAINAINEGKAEEFKAELETLANGKDVDESVRSYHREKQKQIDMLVEEQANLKASGIPEELHEDIMLTKLDHIMSADILSMMESDSARLYSDLQKNRELSPDLVDLKKAKVTHDAWRYINKITQRYKAKLNAAEKLYKQAAEAVGRDVSKDLVTTVDKQLVANAVRAFSMQERMSKIKRDLAGATTPEGIEKLKNALEQEAANRRAQAVLENPDATEEEILTAATQTNDADLSRRLNDIINERNLRKREENKEKTKALVGEKKEDKIGPIREPTIEAEPDYFEPEPSQPEPEPDYDTGPPEPILPDDYDPLTPTVELREAEYEEEVPSEAQLIGEGLFDLLEDRLLEESHNDPKPAPENTTKQEQIRQKPVESRHQNVAHSWTKEVSGSWVEGKFEPNIGASGIPTIQEYTDNRSGNTVSVTEVFATDDNGILLVNTPQVTPGMKVVLKVENDFPYTVTPGFGPSHPSYNDVNRFINIYLADKAGKAKGKPIGQLPSGDGPTATEGDRILRDEVLKAKNQRIVTEIVDKNLGDFLKSPLMNDIRVLEADYYQTEQGEWTFGVTPHKPVIGFIAAQGIVSFPKHELMEGLNQGRAAELAKLDLIERPKDIYPGTVITARTNPKGGLRVTQLHPRKVNKQEIEWLRENFAEFVKDGRISELREVINLSIRDISDLVNLDTFAKDKIHIVGEDIVFSVPSGWVKINARGKFGFNFDNFMKGSNFNFQAYNPDGEKRGALFTPENTTAEDYNGIRFEFDNILTQQYKNVNKDFMNLEEPYTNPVDPGRTYDSYYQYLHQTSSVSTDVPGSMNGPREGLTSGYTFYNTTVYLNPSPQRTDIKVNEETETVEELPSTPVEEKQEQPAKEKEKPGKKSWKDIAKGLEDSSDFGAEFRIAKAASGFETISEKELNWFRERIGDDFLVVAKGIDRILTLGGLEAFGWYHNAMVTLAELGEIGTAYHEAFHFVFNTQLSNSQIASVLRSAKRVYGNLDDLTLEEKLAEDFRLYMLSDGQRVPKVKEAKGFFSRVLTWIKNLVGLKSPIERLFTNTANIRLSEKQKAKLHLKRHLSEINKWNDHRLRLLPGFRVYAQQGDAVMATAHRVMELADLVGRQVDKSIDQVITSPSYLEDIFVMIREQYEGQLSTLLGEEPTQASVRRIMTIAATGAVPENLKEEVSDYLGQWEDIGEGRNISNGFQTEVLKALAKFGFTVSIKGTIVTMNETGDLEEEQIEEDSEIDEGERHIHGLDFFLRSPRKSLSGTIRRFLSTVQEYQQNEDGSVKIGEDGEPVIKKTLFNTPKYIDFNRTYSNLSVKLADSADPFTKLEELSKSNPTLRAVYDRLASELAAGNTSLFTEFQIRFNMSQYQFMTVRIGREEGEPKADVIFSDRRSVEKVIKQDWKENSIKKALIDSDGIVNTGKVAALSKRFQEFLELYTKRKADKNRLTFKELKEKSSSILSDIGIDVSPAVWANIRATDEPSNTLERILFGKRAATLEQFLFLANEKKVDPYSERTIVDVLARFAKDTVEDLHAGTFLNEKNNQVNSINLNSYISEKIKELIDPYTGNDVIAHFQQDNFYKAGNYENRFLKYLKTEEGKSKTRLVILSALKDNSIAKEFEDLTTTDSILSRVVAFHNGGINNGYVYLGTLSDKQRQLMQLLPKSRGANARNFLYQTLRGTVAQEAVRIRRLNKYNSLSKEEIDNFHNTSGVLPTDISSYSKANQFVYIPSINNIPEVSLSLKDGTLDPDSLGDVEDSIKKEINIFIEEQKALFYDKLISAGIIEKTGKNYSNLLLPEAILPEGADVSKFVNEFFYNDLAWRTDISKVIHGDLAFYKDAETYFKRGYQVITPGVKSYVNPKLEGAMSQSNIRRVVFKEIFKTNSDEYLLGLAQLINPNATVKDIVDNSTPEARVVNNYREGVNKTDAQSLSTVHVWRELSKGFGQWTKEHELVYDFAWKDNLSINDAAKQKEVTEDELRLIKQTAFKILLQPLKPFYYGERAINLPDGEVMILKEQFKDSITPLIPDWINRHPHYKQLNEFLTTNKVDIASASDSVKVGNYGASELVGAIESWKIRNLPVSNLRFPQSISPVDKEKITVGTQFWKLIFANMERDKSYNYRGENIRGSQLFEIGQSLWADRVKKYSLSLANSMGLGEDFTLSDDPQKRGDQLFLIKTILEQELESRELHDNYLDAIELVVDDLNRPDFAVNIDFPALGSKFAQVLTNLFKKKIIAQKVPGFSKVNLADYGTSVEHSEELSFIRNEKGQVIEAEVGMSVPYLNKLGIKPTQYNLTTGKLNWNSLSKEQKQALQMIMYRIPTSGKNSMLPIRVTRILPPWAGSVLMVPAEGTKQAGFDFDVDKSFIMHRVINDEGVVDTDHIDNRIFDVAWSILTDKKHVREMITPIDAVVHDDMIKELSDIEDPLGPGNIIKTTTSASPFSIVSDLNAEEIGKHSKRQVGIFSRYSTGHAILQHIKDKVTVNKPIRIDIEGSTYKFNEVGRTFDNEGEYISNNHSALQNSALDAQKDPKLGKLSTNTMNAATVAYMTNLGVSQPLVMRFMNQPVLREFSRYYYQTGGTDMKAATDKLLSVYPNLKGPFGAAGRNRISIITDKNIEEGLAKRILDNVEHQAQILHDFLVYHQAATDMNIVNNVLSVDTIGDMTGIEALESFKNQVTRVSDERSAVVLPQYIFNDLKNSPIKRVVAFYVYGISKAFTLLSQFYAHTSTPYNMVKDNIAHATGRKVLRSKNIIAAANKFLDYYSIVSDGTFDRVIGKYSTGYANRWSYFQRDKSIKIYIEKVMEAVPRIKNNPFVQGLQFDSSPGKVVKLIGVTNTNANYNKTRMTQGWWDLMIDSDPKVRTMAYDLVRFAVKTSGFQYSTSSFYDLIPVQFWVSSGLSRYQKTISAGLRDGAIAYNAAEATRSFIRHNFRMSGLLSTVIYDKDSNPGNLRDITIKREGHLKSFTRKVGEFEEIPRYLKYYDRKSKTWRLYESSPQEPEFYNEIQPLGEPGEYYEVVKDGANRSLLPRNADHGIYKAQTFLEARRLTPVEYMEMSEQALEMLNKYNITPDATVGLVLPKIVENETNPQIRRIGEELLKRADWFDIPIENFVFEDQHVLGRLYVRENPRIQMNVNLLNEETEYRRTLLHEITHVASTRILAKPETEREKNFVDTITRIREEAAKRLPGAYGIVNNLEFVAELASDSKFRSDLKKKGRGLFDRIVRAFRRLFGLSDEYDKVLTELYDLLDEGSNILDIGDISIQHKYKEAPKAAIKVPSLIKRILSSLERRVTRLHRLGREAEARNLSKVVEDIEQAGKVQAILEYIQTVVEEVDVLGNDFRSMNKDPEFINPDVLRIMQEQLNSYGILRDIKKYVRTNPQNYPELRGDMSSTLKLLDSVMGRIVDIKSDVETAAKDRIVYIVKSLVPNKSEDEIRGELEVADRDVTLTNRFLSTPSDSRDVFVNAIATAIRDHKAEAERKTSAGLYKEQADEETIEYLGVKLKYKNHGRAEVNDRYEKWLKKKGLNINNMAERNAAVINQASISGEKYERGIEFISPLLPKGQKILSIPEDSEDYPLRMYYETFVLGYLKSQESINPEWMRPGIRIPSLQRSTVEAVVREKGKGKLHAFSEQVTEALKRRYDDTDYKAVDEAGNPIDYVPIRFTSHQTGTEGRLSRREVSLDIATTVNAFISEMDNHDEMMKIVSDMELVKGALAERSVASTRRKPGFWGILTPDRNQVVGEDGVVVTKSGRQSNAYLWAEQVIRRLLYGQLKRDEGTLSVFGMKVDVAKATDLLTKYTGFAKLSLNMGIAATNLGVGEITAVKEAIGGNIFSWGDWRYGKKMFAKVVPEAFNDLMKRNKQTKFSRVYTFFDPTDRGKYEHSKLGLDTSRFKALLTRDILSSPNKIAEFELSTSLMFTIMNQYKVIDPITKKAVPLYEGLQPKKNGKVGLTEGYKMKEGEFNDDLVDEVRQRIIRTYEKMNGVYNIIDSPGIRESAIGRLVIFMRSWLVPGIEARWRLKNYDNRLKSYDEGHYLSSVIFFTNVFGPNNGLIASTAKSLRFLFAQANDEDLLAPSEVNLSPDERQQIIDLRRANMKKTLFELYVIAGISALMMLAWDEDDRDSYTLMLLARMRRELMTFFSPSTAWDVLRSPTVALDSIEGLGKLTYYSSVGLMTGEAYKLYERGPREGESRIEASIKDRIPLWSQRHQFDDLEKKIQLIERGWR